MTSTTPRGSCVVHDRPGWAKSDVCFRSGLIHFFEMLEPRRRSSPITKPTSVRYASSRGLRRSDQSASKMADSSFFKSNLSASSCARRQEAGRVRPPRNDARAFATFSTIPVPLFVVANVSLPSGLGEPLFRFRLDDNRPAHGFAVHLAVILELSCLLELDGLGGLARFEFLGVKGLAVVVGGGGVVGAGLVDPDDRLTRGDL